jgi:polyisoprenoid-binding protein YceI
MISKVRGTFNALSGTIQLPADGNVPVEIDVTIDATSIDTRDAQRDGHLKSPDFLEVDKYPTITFTGNHVAATGGDDFTVSGDLTIHGTTKPVTFKASITGAGKDPWGNDRVAYEGSTKISRKDFGLVWNQALEAGGVAVGDEVEVTIDVETLPAS